MHKGFIKTSIVFAILSVILGTLSAHTLKGMISDYAISIFDTGVRYQFYHVFALLGVGILYKEFPNRFTKFAGWLFIIGIILFSGSLYFLAYLKASVNPHYKWVGPITPVGGLCFILGWVSLFIAVTKKSLGH